ncbi:MAG: hypothetical protein ACE5G5_01450 [Candidatus Methylomirabilales bacterium]
MAPQASAQAVPYLPFWRRRFYVHPIQRKYFLLTLWPLAFCAFLVILSVFAPLNLALHGSSNAIERMAILQQIYALGTRIWPAFIISMAACGIHSFFVTNRFAGPIYRIEQILKRVEDGDLPVAVRIRRGDDLQDFAGNLDSAFRTISSTLTAIKEQQAQAAKEIAALHEKAKAGLNGEVVKGLEMIGRNQRELETILANLKTPKPQA